MIDPLTNSIHALFNTSPLLKASCELCLLAFMSRRALETEALHRSVALLRVLSTVRGCGCKRSANAAVQRGQKSTLLLNTPDRNPQTVSWATHMMHMHKNHMHTVYGH